MTPVASLANPEVDYANAPAAADANSRLAASSVGLVDDPTEPAGSGKAGNDFLPTSNANGAASQQPQRVHADDARDCSAAYRELEKRFAHAKNHYVILPAGNRSWLYLSIKRLLDIVGALLGIALFSPILLITYVVLSITTKGHAIFVQERVGLCGRIFPMYKFRTMRLDAERVQYLVKNEKDGPIFKNVGDPRITRIGRFMRSTSIDELPQLFNVLRGDMSLVGPRPPIPAEVAKYQPWQRARLRLKPGLTCLWQVSGRSEIGFEDWVRMDIWYSQHQNLGTDVKLLAKTPASVLSRRGAY
jgi:lipopolysaccharide/colanic/teichoic acid biosynthesis glycosyltransferase